MNKKLLAVAVAGVLAAPTAALAQSSVTISGFFKMSFGQLKIDQAATGANNNAFTGNGAVACRNLATGQCSNTSETRLTDDSSRIVFNVVEDLGGGLQAIGQVDWRIAPDSGVDGGGPVGNNHVGLRSKTWGRIFVGRQDLHYFNRESDLTVKGDLKADSISILAFSGTGAFAVANATRTPNVIHYTTPNWGGFTLIAAYSTNPLGATENDLGNTSNNQRKGQGWSLNPNFAGPNWQVGYSYWTAKQDGPASTAATDTNNPVGRVQSGVLSANNGIAQAPAAGAQILSSLVTQLGASDQRSDRLYGSYSWGGFKVGLAWDRSKLKAVNASAVTGVGAGVEWSNRTAWSLPVSYTWGPHSIHGHYDKARSDRSAFLSGLDTSAKMWALSYQYDLSKRTSLAANYAKITNGAQAQYNFFTSTSGAIGSPDAAINFGEDPRLVTVTIRHAF